MTGRPHSRGRVSGQGERPMDRWHRLRSPLAWGGGVHDTPLRRGVTVQRIGGRDSRPQSKATATTPALRWWGMRHRDMADRLPVWYKTRISLRALAAMAKHKTGQEKTGSIAARCWMWQCQSEMTAVESSPPASSAGRIRPPTNGKARGTPAGKALRLLPLRVQLRDRLRSAVHTSRSVGTHGRERRARVS